MLFVPLWLNRVQIYLRLETVQEPIMTESFLPYTHQSIDESDLQAVSTALKGDVITRGEHVENFEKAIADYCGAAYAVSFNSGTAALMGAYFAANLTPYDCVVSTPNSFIATVGAPIQCGAKIEFVDIDRQTGSLDLARLQEPLKFRSTRGKLIVSPVHFSGIPIDMQRLERQISHPDTVVIEDAAHAIGSTYADGHKIGSCQWSDMTMFSFHPAKTITTGEGGLVTTNDPELYHRLRLFRNNGIERDAPYIEGTPAPWYYEVHAISGNFHVTEFQAALGLSQLKRIDAFIEKRRRLVKRYRDQLQGIRHLKLFTDAFDAQTAFHLFVVQIDFEAIRSTRDRVMNQLKARGIGTQLHYIPLYRQPIFQQRNGDHSEEFPEMERYYAQALSLPLYYDLSENDVDRVCRELKRCF